MHSVHLLFLASLPPVAPFTPPHALIDAHPFPFHTRHPLLLLCCLFEDEAGPTGMFQMNIKVEFYRVKLDSFVCASAEMSLYLKHII